MAGHEVSITDTTDSADKEAVYSWLREYNHTENRGFMQARENGSEKSFFLIARNSEGSIVGGLEGSTFLHWLRIDIMAVNPPDRGYGIGKQLMQRAEELGTSERCRYSYVDTMSYQAPYFYRMLGYEQAGLLPDWDSHGHDKYFFVKALQSDT